MQCDDIQLDITAYLHGGLPPGRQSEVEHHMSTCQACSEEAAAMRDIGRLLGRGLNEWVDDGVCPPDVLDRIEESLRPARRRTWWQSGPAYAGAVAAVFLILVVVASRSVDISHQLASIPLVGGLATNLLYPGTDIEVDDLTGRVPGQPVASTEHDGVRLDLYQPVLGTDAVRIQYSLRGAGMNTQAAMTRFEAELAGSGGVLKLQRTRIARTGDQVLVSAEYEPVLPGQALTLTVKNLPLRTPAAQAVWQVAVKP